MHILQVFGTDREAADLAALLLLPPPEQSLPFRMRDHALQLMVGADAAEPAWTPATRGRAAA